VGAVDHAAEFAGVDEKDLAATVAEMAALILALILALLQTFILEIMFM